jgi:NTE family protein
MPDSLCPTTVASLAPRHINLALQGGGAHGAFTWGVLHKLMSDRRIRIDGLSGTSAGAMNAVVMADGFIKGRRDGAIAAVGEFWRRISVAGFSHRMMNLWTRGTPGWNIDHSPPFAFFDLVTRLFSPYELNPFDINPLRDIIADMVDFETLRAHDEIKLFVTATNVKTCKPKVFRTPELTARMLMASACVPLLFKAVEVDGEHYWDGGYMGNPSIYPLIHESKTPDVVIVQINPLKRQDVPTKARDILNRITELSFNSSLVREMRGVATITSLIDSGRLAADQYGRVHFHMIDAHEELPSLGVSSKFTTDFGFLEYLHDLGFSSAESWLDENFDKIGVSSSLDVFEAFI